MIDGDHEAGQAVRTGRLDVVGAVRGRGQVLGARDLALVLAHRDQTVGVLGVDGGRLRQLAGHAVGAALQAVEHLGLAAADREHADAALGTVLAGQFDDLAVARGFLAQVAVAGHVAGPVRVRGELGVGAGLGGFVDHGQAAAAAQALGLGAGDDRLEVAVGAGLDHVAGGRAAGHFVVGGAGGGSDDPGVGDRAGHARLGGKGRHVGERPFRRGELAGGVAAAQHGDALAGDWGLAGRGHDYVAEVPATGHLGIDLAGGRAAHRPRRGRGGAGLAGGGHELGHALLGIGVALETAGQAVLVLGRGADGQAVEALGHVAGLLDDEAGPFLAGDLVDRGLDLGLRIDPALDVVGVGHGAVQLRRLDRGRRLGLALIALLGGNRRQLGRFGLLRGVGGERLSADHQGGHGRQYNPETFHS